MDELMQALEAETPRRIVIFDMPPVLAADDVLAFAPQVDGLLMVVAEGTTDRDALRGAKEVLEEMNLLGVVLNRSAERKRRRVLLVRPAAVTRNFRSSPALRREGAAAVRPAGAGRRRLLQPAAARHRYGPPA